MLIKYSAVLWGCYYLCNDFRFGDLLTAFVHHRKQDIRLNTVQIVTFCLLIFIFRSSLGGFYQRATLKIVKWHLLTWSQLCLSPSHSKHSPTLLTLSRWGRRSLSMRADEARLIEKGNVDRSLTTHSPGCSVSGQRLLDKRVLSDTLPLLSLIWVHGPELREKTHLLWRQVCHKIPQARLALNHPKRLFWIQRRNSLHNGWLCAKMAGEVH